MIVQPIDLNMIPDSPPVILHCDQYDEGTGRISAHLYDGDQSYTPTNATVMIQGTKPDGHGFAYSATLSGNTVTADLTEQMTACAGDVRCQIVVTETSGRTGSFAFTLSVQKSALPSDTDMSASDYQIIEELIEDVQEAVGTATQSASDAEAWAVGERGGEPVSPTDPTYQNNAEYWAHYAEEHGSVPVMTGSILGIGSPDDLTTIATSGIITAKGVAISATVNPSGTEHGANWFKRGTTVLTPDSEQMYLVYIDNAPTLWTWDGTAYVQISGGGGPTGSTITVTTTETTLFGEDVTLTDGTSTLTETFDATGTAVFTGVTMTGTLTATSTDGSSTATGTVTVTDPGTYSVQINFWIATINITTDSPDLYGQTITVKNSNNVTVATTTFSNLGAASVTVGSADTYTVSCLTESDNVTVSAQTTYSVSLHLWTATLSISTSDSSLYGEPIDIQRGGTYVGRTTFSNAGTASYNVHDTGTYYVTCQGNTETVTVSAETTYNVQIKTLRTMTVVLDLTDSNPLTWATYADDAVGMTVGSDDWDTFFGHYPCILDNGVELGKLKRTDFSQYEDGTSAPITTLGKDVMICYPRRGIKIEYLDANTLSVSITDEDNKTGYSYMAHSYKGVRCDKFYFGAYMGYGSSDKLYSVSGQLPTETQTLGTFRNWAQARGVGYELDAYLQIIYLEAMYTLKYKGQDSKLAIGLGYVGASSKALTGNTNLSGMDYGTSSKTNQIKLFGIEDFWGNLRCLVDGIVTNLQKQILVSDGNYNDTGTGYTVAQSVAYTGNDTGCTRYPIGTNLGGFMNDKTKGVFGSATTYFCSYSNYDSSNDVRTGAMGEYYGAYFNISNTSSTGVYSIKCTETQNYANYRYGTRLMYMHTAA